MIASQSASPYTILLSSNTFYFACLPQLMTLLHFFPLNQHLRHPKSSGQVCEGKGSFQGVILRYDTQFPGLFWNSPGDFGPPTQPLNLLYIFHQQLKIFSSSLLGNTEWINQKSYYKQQTAILANLFRKKDLNLKSLLNQEQRLSCQAKCPTKCCRASIPI